MTTQKYTFHVHGMHCNACVLMTESELGDLPNVTHVKASFKNHSVEVEGNFGDKTPGQIAEELTIPLMPHGYTVSVEKQVKEKNWADFKIAIPIALAFLALFVILQKIGLINLIGVGVGNVTYGSAFVIGVVASLSSCMAVVGGLVLSMSATFAKEGDKVRPQILFHTGRIVSFFVLGGVIGLAGIGYGDRSGGWNTGITVKPIGAAFLSDPTVSMLSIGIGIVMLILGINLLDVFHWAKRLQPSMPKFISKHVLGISKTNHTLTPLLVGIATFFLPCGFTQSMQLYTLTTGSFLTGGFTMLAFALGTLPVLALISFSSFSIQNSRKAGIFFKTAGLIVIMFALFNLVNSLVMIGIIPPIFNF